MVRGLGSLFKALGKRFGKAKPEPRPTEPAVPQSVDEAIVTGVQKRPQVPVPTRQVPVRFDPSDNPYQGPLNMGEIGNRPMYGSQLYDWTTAKGNGSFTADEWLDHFLTRSTKKVKSPLSGMEFDVNTINGRTFQYGKNYEGGNLFNELFPGNNQGRVSLEELFDTGLAGFDKSGNLVSGILHAAKQSGVKLDTKSVLDIIKNNPVNHLQVKTFVMEPHKQVLQGIQNEIADFSNTTVLFRNGAKEQSRDALVSANKHLNQIFKNADELDASSLKYEIEEAQKYLTKIRNDVTPNDRVRINQLMDKLDSTMKSVNNPAQPKVRYKDTDSYTLAGGENYREIVVKYPGPIMKNDNPLKSMSHYSDEKNMLYFSRFDTRYTQDGKKVLFIHDVQSDANQKIAKILRAANKTGFEGDSSTFRKNPYMEDVTATFYENARKKLVKDLDELTPGDSKANAILSQLRTIDKSLKSKMSETTVSSLDASARKAFPDRSYDIPDREYFPFLQSSSYGNHALRMHLKRAADEGYDYVAIAPYERVSVRDGTTGWNARTQRNESMGREGNALFYGNAYGKDPKNPKIQAIMPKLMKQNAKFHGSDAKTIKVAFSDPKKPYKDIRKSGTIEENMNAYERARAKARFEHKAAYSTDKNGIYTKVDPSDPNLYFDAFAIKVTPSMKGPVQSYNTGGLVVDMFKPL